MCPALDEAGRDGIAGPREDDGRNAGRLGGGGAGVTRHDQDLRPLRSEFIDESRQLPGIRHRAARLEGEIPIECIAEVGESADQDFAERRIGGNRRARRQRSQAKGLVGLSEGRRRRGETRREERKQDAATSNMEASSALVPHYMRPRGA